MTRAERIESALLSLVRERANELNALTSVRVVEVTLVLDDAGLVDSQQVRYESPKERIRATRQRCVA